MKRLIPVTRMMFVMLAASFIFLSSCKKNNDDPKPVELLPKLDGFYIYGTNTVAEAATDPTARMALAALDSFKDAHILNAPGYYGKFLYIGASSKIKFAQVVNEVGTSYGAAGGGATDSTTTVGNMDAKDMTIHGTLVEGESEINVTEEGLYYAFVDATSGDIKFTLTRVRTNVIGDATENGWGTQTDMTQVFTSKDSTVWQVTGLNLMQEHGYKYRLPKGGWQFYNDGNIITVSSLAVKNYGESWAADHNDIGLFNENIPTQLTGVYTLRVTYFAATDTWKEYKTKTGDWVPLIDYTDYSMSIWGDAFIIPGSNPAEQANWNAAYDSKAPSVVGKVFTWTWTNVPLIEGYEFIFIEGASWTGKMILDAKGVTTSNGTAIADDVHKDADDPAATNYHVYVGGSYDVTLVFDNTNSAAPTKTATINVH